MQPRQLAHIRAYHNGDVQQRLATWSHRDPVTLFGAWVPRDSGWTTSAGPSHRSLPELLSLATSGSRWSRLVPVGDLAHIVAFEHDVMNIDGASRAVTMHAPHVSRREDDEWKIVHRHSDFRPAADQPIGVPATTPADTASR
jgi:hypothetical protein